MVRSDSANVIRVSAVLPHARLIGNDVPLASCCSDATRVQPGDIFVALVHGDGDDHFHANRAVQRGAAAIIAERLLPVSVPQYLVDDSRDAYGTLCQHLVGKPSRRMCTIGVTGTHGKTTIAMLIGAILETAGETTGWSTSLGSSSGSEPRPLSGNSCQPPEIARSLADMSASGCSAAILEVNSRALAARSLAGVEFDIAVLSNVRRANIDLHGSVFNYRQAKLQLLRHLKSPGLAIINTDDRFLQAVASQLSAPVLATGLADGSDITATVIERTPSEQTFLLTMGCDTVAVRTRVIGDHYVSHCLQAAAACVSLGVDLPTVVRGIESIDSFPGRMERIECGQPFSVFVDGAQNPERLAMALNTLRKVTRGRVIAVYGPEGDAPDEYRPWMGRVAERGADVGVITSNNPGDQQPLDIAHSVMDGYQRPARAHYIADRQKAIHWALSQAQPGDSLLIAGKGERNGQNLGNRLLPFDDRDVARNWLYGEQPSLMTSGTDEPVILRMF